MNQEEFRKRYEFNIKTDTIGGGSFGTVYKAYDTILDREVAIKVSEVKSIGNKEFSLLEEYKAIETLNIHQNIANYEQVYRFESFPTVFDYGVMQYYSLGNLSSYLKNNEVSLEKRESITIGILEGIAFLHQYKVVHRDLKPSNILVVDRRGKIIPKITDFGLSKQASLDGKASRFTNSFAGGTLQYSSPEQLKGLPLKLNTDLWSFGAIAYEVLTGVTLFEAKNTGTASAEWQNLITQKILHSDVSDQLQKLSPKWQNVISRCLDRDINTRVQKAEFLLGILNGDKNETITDISKEQVLKKSKSSKNEGTTIKEKKNPAHAKKQNNTADSSNSTESKTKIKETNSIQRKKVEKTIKKVSKTKINSKRYYYLNDSRMYLARVLTFVFSIIVIILINYFFLSSSGEPEYNEMQPDYGNDLEKDLEYVFEIFNYLVFIKIYCLSFILFQIKNVSWGQKFLISIALIIGVFILFIFLGVLTGSIIGIPFLLLVLFLIYNFIYWIKFWRNYKRFKKIELDV